MAQFIEAKGNPGTQKVYRAGLCSFLSFIYKRPARKRIKYGREEFKALDELSSRYLKEVKKGERRPAQDLTSYGGFLHGRPPQTARANTSAISMWFLFNEIELTQGQRQMVKSNLPKGRSARPGFQFDTDTIRRILLHADPLMKAAILTLASSGMRDGELVELRPSDVDFSHDPVKVILQEGTTKTGSGRTTYISTEAARLLEHWIERERGRYIGKKARFVPKGETKADLSPNSAKSDDRIFPITYETFISMFRRTVARAGFDQDKRTVWNRREIKPHKLRAFFRTEFAKAGGNAVDVAEICMGHEGYLSSSYRLIPEADIEKTYKAAERFLTIEAPVQVSTEEIQQLQEKNTQLEKELETIRTAIANQQAIEAYPLFNEVMKAVEERLAKAGISP